MESLHTLPERFNQLQAMLVYHNSISASICMPEYAKPLFVPTAILCIQILKWMSVIGE